MKTKSSFLLKTIFVSGFLLLFVILPIAAQAQDYNALLSNLRFREIGPATMGGRINDIEVPLQDTSIIYASTASGGIWKSINGGTTWTGIFNNEEVSTVGDLAVAPSDPNILYAGTGESNNRQSSSWGKGVYKLWFTQPTQTPFMSPPPENFGELVLSAAFINQPMAEKLGCSR
jgi:hypothetical protein